jgi:signal peptidase II
LATRWKILIAVTVGLVIVDQVTKFQAVDALTRVFELEKADTLERKIDVFLEERHLERLRTRPVEVIPGFWQHRYVENPGAAWGSFRGLPENLRVPFFYVISAIAVTFIVVFYRRLEERQRWLQVSLALVMGGAIGNFVDRLIRGYVIDFIDWYWNDAHWPTFNLADVGISVGVTMMLAEALFARKKDDTRAPEPPGEEA